MKSCDWSSFSDITGGHCEELQMLVYIKQGLALDLVLVLQRTYSLGTSSWTGSRTLWKMWLLLIYWKWILMICLIPTLWVWVSVLIQVLGVGWSLFTDFHFGLSFFLHCGIFWWSHVVLLLTVRLSHLLPSLKPSLVQIKCTVWISLWSFHTHLQWIWAYLLLYQIPSPPISFSFPQLH